MELKEDNLATKLSSFNFRKFKAYYLIEKMNYKNKYDNS